MRRKTVLLALELCFPVALIMLWVIFGTSLGPSVTQVGGIRLLYELDAEGVELTDDVRDQICTVVRNRLNPKGEVNLAVSCSQCGHLEIMIPKASLSDRRRRNNYLSQWERLSNVLVQKGADPSVLEAVLDRPGAQRASVVDALQHEYTDLWQALDRVVLAYDAYSLVAQRLRLDDAAEVQKMLSGLGQLELRILPLMNEGELDQRFAMGERDRLHEHGGDDIAAVGSDQGYVWLPIHHVTEQLLGNGIVGSYSRNTYLLVSNAAGQKMVSSDGLWAVSDAEVELDDEGNWTVGVSFDDAGGDLFERFTGDNLGRTVAVVVDGEVISTVQINSVQHDRVCILDGLSWNEATDLAVKLESGALPFALSDTAVEVSELLPFAEGEKGR